MRREARHVVSKLGRAARRVAATRRLLVASLAAVLTSAPAAGADVEVTISSREIYADVPFSVTIAISDAADFDTPVFPEVAGLEVLGPPTRSTRSFTSIVNGRATQSDTVSLSYSLVASQPGRLTVPSITVVADGTPQQTTPFTIDVRRPDAGDRLIAEIAAAKVEYFQGEAVELTLRIWIKAYEDPALSGPLNGETMWSLVDLQRSAWGDFLEPIRETLGRLGSRQRLPGRRVMRPDDDGETALYHLYELDVTLWPQQSGALAIDPVVVMMQYPERLRKSRRVFSRGDLEIASSRLLIARAEPPAVTVIPPPAEGRPPWYRDAVGRFDLEVSARPTVVAVGDPITLTMRIKDRTPGGGRLALVQPPPLAELPEIAADFKVPTDPLAGLVEGDAKVFTQTIRVRDDSVTAIPAIPFAAFDPDLERYVTVMSDPIAIEVSPASTLDVGDVIGANGAAGNATELTAVSGGILANATDPDALLASQAFRLGWMHLAVVLAPPVLFGCAAVTRRRIRRLRHDDGYARRRGARRNAMRRLDAVDRGPASARAETIVLTLSDYVADRVGAPSGALTRVEAIERLRGSDVDPDLVAEVAELLEACERARYGGDVNGAADGVSDRARRCVERLERERIR